MVSIIIPIYNSEKYLKECIKSVINQTYKDLEIILIDDGSTDNSYNICQKFVEENSNIKFFSHENRGVSYTRNVGIENSKGEFICFVDSDDWLENNMIETMVDNLKECDAVVSNYYVDENKIKDKSHINASVNIIDNKNIVYNIFELYGGYLWNKIFKRSMIEEYEIRFDEDIKMGEDLLFVCKYFREAKKVRCITESLYHYRTTENSVSNKKIDEKYLTILSAYEEILNLFSNTPLKDYIYEKFFYINIRMKSRIFFEKNLELNKNKLNDNILKSYRILKKSNKRTIYIFNIIACPCIAIIIKFKRILKSSNKKMEV